MITNYANEDIKISYSQAVKYAHKHDKEIRQLVEHLSKDEMLEAQYLLNLHEWNSDLLGEFKSAIFAFACWHILQEILGRYETERYMLIRTKQCTEENVDREILKRLVDDYYRPHFI